MLGRRKTTTSATISSRTRSVVDHLRSSTTYQDRCVDGSRSRPVSWHPNSIDALNIPSDLAVNGPDLSAWNFATAQVHGLVTPISYPVGNEPHIQELATPLDELPGQDMAFHYNNPNVDESGWFHSGSIKPDSYAFNMYQEQRAPLEGRHGQMLLSTRIPTAPSSPTCLPVQNIRLNNLSLKTPGQESEELVGMGLYDSPAEVQSSSLLFGSMSKPERKSLKLEESFEPAELDEEPDDDAEQDDESIQSDTRSEDAFPSSDRVEYGSRSIADHLDFGAAPEPDSLASRYLETLTQLNSAYYPAGYHSYGWI